MGRAHRSSREYRFASALIAFCWEAIEAWAASRREAGWFSLLAIAFQADSVTWPFDCGTSGWLQCKTALWEGSA